MQILRDSVHSDLLHVHLVPAPSRDGWMKGGMEGGRDAGGMEEGRDAGGVQDCVHRCQRQAAPCTVIHLQQQTDTNPHLSIMIDHTHRITNACLCICMLCMYAVYVCCVCMLCVYAVCAGIPVALGGD